MQFLTTGIQRRDHVIHRLAKEYGAKTTNTWDHQSIPVLVGNSLGMDLIQIECRQRGIPYVYIDHGYFRRSFNLGYYRICVSNFHCTDWRDSDRKASGKPKDWETDGEDVVILAPTDAVKDVYQAHDWLDKTVETVKNSTNRKIIIKYKGIGGLSDVLENAFAVVSFGSVADVESVMRGIPIFCSEYSPAIPIGLTDFTKIETPIYPDRAKWLRSLAAAEYEAGEELIALERICPFLHTQNFKTP